MFRRVSIRLHSRQERLFAATNVIRVIRTKTGMEFNTCQPQAKEQKRDTGELWLDSNMVGMRMSKRKPYASLLLSLSSGDELYIVVASLCRPITVNCSQVIIKCIYQIIITFNHYNYHHQHRFLFFSSSSSLLTINYVISWESLCSSCSAISLPFLDLIKYSCPTKNDIRFKSYWRHPRQTPTQKRAFLAMTNFINWPSNNNFRQYLRLRLRTWTKYEEDSDCKGQTFKWATSRPDITMIHLARLDGFRGRTSSAAETKMITKVWAQIIKSPDLHYHPRDS